MAQNHFFRSTCSLWLAGLLCAHFAPSQETTDASSSDRKFVHSALEGGNAEVKLAQLATRKGNSQSVKQFGQKLADDHTKLANRMKQIAQQEGIDIPEGISGKDKAMESKLGDLSGDAFDKAFIRAMVEDHRKDLSSFNKEATSGNETSIKDLASEGSQIISEHLHLAERMAQERNIQTSQGEDND